jgi:DNA helicase-2/ATP-dependent DNA helicase PcrA
LDLATGFDNDLKGFLEALRFETVSESKGLMGERVTLLSIHSAKGLEWEVVFLCGAEEGILPFTLLEDGDPEEEKRLFYVAVTRAKKRLYITHCKNRRLMWKSLQLTPSSFLDLLPQDVVIWDKNKRKSLVQLPLFWQK